MGSPTRKGSSPIKVWVTPEEKVAIAEKADQHGLSQSAFLRKLGLGYEVESTLDQKAILELVKVNADVGRLGGLFKLWLTKDDRTIDYETVKKALARIEQLQSEMLSKVEKL